MDCYYPLICWACATLVKRNQLAEGLMNSIARAFITIHADTKQQKEAKKQQLQQQFDLTLAETYNYYGFEECLIKITSQPTSLL